MIFRLAERLTGACQSGEYRRDVVVSNVWKRMHRLGIENLAIYLRRVEADPAEFDHFISLLTIHTTSWFREMPHFESLKKMALKRASMSKEPLTVWSAACSTGEEPYSIAMVLESVRQSVPGFEYKVYASDIDSISVETTQRAVYPREALRQIPDEFQKFLLRGSGKTEGLIAVVPEIRKRCHFFVHHLESPRPPDENPAGFDFVFCRNILIYFAPGAVGHVIKKILSVLKPHGVLCVGHSEILDIAAYDIKNLENTMYVKAGAGEAVFSEKHKTVLLVGTATSALEGLCKNTEFRTAMASSPEEILGAVKAQKMDLVLVDLKLLLGKEVRWLRQLKTGFARTLVVVVGDVASGDADEVLRLLEEGVHDFIEKSLLRANPAEALEQLRSILSARKTVKSTAVFSRSREKGFAPDILVLGASTGGTEALAQVLKDFPPNCPPVVVVQHISHGFAKAFAEKLASISGLRLGNPDGEEPLRNGHLYLSWGDYHIGVAAVKGQMHLISSGTLPINHHRPSVDFLFNSTATTKLNVVAVLLTGMGRDGASGLFHLRKQGAFTMAQDEQSSVVFGMPREAIELNAAAFVGNTVEIRGELLQILSFQKAKLAN